jgi:RNA polymerase sigma factor for flagellar operon FliA
MGQEGLLDAARRFDESRGVRFKHYANYRVRGAMLDGIRKSSRLPRRTHARLRALEAALLVAEGAAEDAASPEAAKAMSDAHAAEQKLGEHLANMATAMAMGLLVVPATGEEGELFAADTKASPEEAVAEAELRALVAEALRDLPEDERALVKRHYFDGERFDHVAKSLGLSKSWGSRLHTRAVARLTKRLRTLSR